MQFGRKPLITVPLVLLQFICMYYIIKAVQSVFIGHTYIRNTQNYEICTYDFRDPDLFRD